MQVDVVKWLFSSPTVQRVGIAIGAASALVALNCAPALSSLWTETPTEIAAVADQDRSRPGF